MKREYLLAPGPTPVPERARLAMARSIIHHRGPEFKELFAKVQADLKWLYETEQTVLGLTCSGTGAFEAAISNFTCRGDTIVCVGGGKFGERWADVGRTYDLDVIEIDVEWGESVDPSEVAEVLSDHPDCAMVTLTASETSTGVLHRFEDVADVVADHGRALFAVDGITAVGAHRVSMDETGIDILVSGSQKAFGIPPGLGFLAASDRAWQRHEASDHPGYYFDLGREKGRQVENQTAFTPAISVFVAAREALAMMREEGREALYGRHQRNAEATREGVRALGLKTLASRPADSVTAVLAPEAIPAPEIVRHMRDNHGAVIAGGQKEFKPRLFRLGHIGFFDRTDILTALSALELTLGELGWDTQPGAALAAAQRVYARSD